MSDLVFTMVLLPGGVRETYSFRGQVKPWKETSSLMAGWILDIKKGTAVSTYFIHSMVSDGRKMDHYHHYRFW